MKRRIVTLMFAALGAMSVYANQTELGISRKSESSSYAWQRAPRFRAMFGNYYTFGAGSYAQDRYGVDASFGCQITPYVYVGAGMAFDYWDNFDECSIPFFAHFRSEFHKSIGRNASPFVDVKLGYSPAEVDGVYFNPSVGCHFYFGHSRVGLSAYLGYVLQNPTVDEWSYHGGKIYERRENASGVRMGVAIDF